MGLFQRLFGRKKTTGTKETIHVEIDGDHADVTPVTTTTEATTKPAARANNTANAKTTTKQCAGTTKAGTQCKRAPVGRSRFCATHKN